MRPVFRGVGGTGGALAESFRAEDVSWRATAFGPVFRPQLAEAGGLGDLARMLAGLVPAEFARRVPGRESFAWPGRPELFVKRLRGGDARDFWFERLHRGPNRSPARREAENLAALAADGFDVPRPLLWLEARGAERHPHWGGRDRVSVLVMETIAHRTTLRAALESASPALTARTLERLAELVARFHRAGWYHRDLYLEHLVLAEGEDPGTARFVLLDAGRARRQALPRTRWLVKDLAAIRSSLGERVGTDERFAAFLVRWLELAGRGAPERSATWLRRVDHKARALRDHAPRHVFTATKPGPLMAETGNAGTGATPGRSKGRGAERDAGAAGAARGVQGP